MCLVSLSHCEQVAGEWQFSLPTRCPERSRRISWIRIIKFLLATVLLFPIPAAHAFSVMVPATDVTTHMLGGIPGTLEELPIKIQIGLAFPLQPRVNPFLTTGSGITKYRLSGQIARVFGEDIPQTYGESNLLQESSVTLQGLKGSLFAVTWGNGQDFLIQGLDLKLTISHKATDAIDVKLYNLKLTTGVIRVAGQTVRGAINVHQQQLSMVGTFTMPETGNPKLDSLIAGKPVLLSIIAGAKELGM